MSDAEQYTSGIITPLVATILNGQTKSNIIDTYGVTIVQVEMPAAFTGGILTFETSSDGTTFQPYYNTNNLQVAITCSAARNHGLAAQDFFTTRFFKVVSNLAEAADREIRFVAKSI